MQVIISNKKSEKIMSVNLYVIVIIDFKRYTGTYCLIQGRCFICSDI